MKPSTQWTEEDIQVLIINKVKENLELDYKDCRSLKKDDPSKKELSKDVSAFANSAGGVLVYGVQEEGHLPTKIDVGYDPKEISREWLESVINSRIQRRIDGVHINQIELEKSSPGKVMYVVTIPQSTNAPHMASDNRFYKRFNFQSQPMEEYEVRDVARRNEAPDLYVSVRLDKGTSSDFITCKVKEKYCEPISFYLGVGNKAPQPAEHAIIRIIFDSRLKIINAGELTVATSAFLSVGSQKIPVHALSINWGIPGKMPIFEGLDFNLTAENNPVQMAFPSTQDTYFFGWEILSPRMTLKRKFYDMIFKDAVVTIYER